MAHNLFYGHDLNENVKPKVYIDFLCKLRRAQAAHGDTTCSRLHVGILVFATHWKPFSVTKWSI